MSPRPDVSEERKFQILNAAEEVFAEKGFEKARMEDIAKETGLSKGAIYLYFESKNDLIIAILDRLFNREYRQFENMKSEEFSAVDAIRNFSQTVTSDMDAVIRLFPILYQFLSLAFRNKYVQYAFKKYLNRYLDLITTWIQRGIDSGELRPVDPREVAIAVGAIIEGTFLLWVYDRSAIDPGRHVHSGIELLLEGILAEK